MATVVTNIGILVSGDINNPILKGDTILIQDGKIAAIGDKTLLDQVNGEKDVKKIDVGGMAVMPGFIDSHVHPVIGDFTPRQNMLDYIGSALHGGVTSMISAGECHTPGRPKDPAGVKALAILAHKSFANARPAGVKLHGGAVILEKGLTEADFVEMAAAGVWLVGEVGLGAVKKPAEAAPMVKLAQKHGMKVAMHTGGTSIPGSSTVTADDVMKVNPDVVSHVNGGPTAISPAEIDKLINETNLTLEIVQCGNSKIADMVVKKLAAKKQLNRVIFGNDAPSGTGVIPLGIVRNIAQIAGVSGIPAVQAIAMATGNTAKTFGLNTGLIAVGKEADLVIADKPMGSVGGNALEALEAGDLLGISMVLIDGKIMFAKSRNTPPAERKVTVL
ncbi:amidohydrolase family protein [Sporomusa acidovorans]|uniref:Enamidase n=1 Tax=Sporomusa acidovorans (strain ATCC 49682 / DSM 3132 / Mol) TaxID=1123286 RepID=A0ABZ3J318_SPOA4|nr:amidohydrolase family protein [Sporomusa acidovorans]OZC19957.1 enamidase [Sporomusa acidovorans DSM 3132]SDD49078.1 enamidase [Sporomusa acidovorans]